MYVLYVCNWVSQLPAGGPAESPPNLSSPLPAGLGSFGKERRRVLLWRDCHQVGVYSSPVGDYCSEETAPAP